MLNLNADEARLLGVLIEKATTTPDLYPLTLNALLAGANQKNNRDPVVALTDDEVYDSAETLREKGLVVRVDQAGARVHKYRHNAGDVLKCRAGELALLAELLMRGPQTLGELRGRASRMAAGALETLDDARAMIRALTDRPEPLVKEIAPSPGSRAERYAQRLFDDERANVSTEGAGEIKTIAPATATLSDRVTSLEAEVARLRQIVDKFAVALGEPDAQA